MASRIRDNQKRIVTNLAFCCFLCFLSYTGVALAADSDGDLFSDAQDNCINEPNGANLSNQLDSDLDGIGNACDGDFNNDTVVDALDEAVILSCINGGLPSADRSCSESDMDGSGVVDGLDIVLFGKVDNLNTSTLSGIACANADGSTAPCYDLQGAGDSDGDGVANHVDNCAIVINPVIDTQGTQLDADFDGFGNQCDGDLNNDGVVDNTDSVILDSCAFQYVPANGPSDTPTCAEADMNGDGYVDTQDSQLFFFAFLKQQPGPSALECGLSPAGYACITSVTGQAPDLNYIPRLETPRFSPGTGPVVAIDATHSNAHTVDTGFIGFARLLRADGYRVQAFNEPFTPGCFFDLQNCAYYQALLTIDTLVIANAVQDISAEEAFILTRWVDGSFGCGGGCSHRRLFLIADHQSNEKNFPAHIRELSQALGLNWPNNNVPGNRTFTAMPPYDAATGGILNSAHPIVSGNNPNESVVSVTTIFGSAFTAPALGGTGISLLTLPEGSETTGPEGDPDAAGYSQGMAFELGSGRVYASSEAAMFTTQVALSIPAYRLVHQVGMHTMPRNHNQQFLLNIMAWLDRDL